MPQVLLRDLDAHPASDGVAGVRVPHPVRAGVREPLCPLRIAVPSQHIGAFREEGLDLAIERRRSDPLPRDERLAGVQSRCRFPFICHVRTFNLPPTLLRILQLTGLRRERPLTTARKRRLPVPPFRPLQFAQPCI